MQKKLILMYLAYTYLQSEEEDSMKDTIRIVLALLGGKIVLKQLLEMT